MNVLDKSFRFTGLAFLSMLMFSCKEKDKSTVDPVADYSGVYKGTLAVTASYGTVLLPGKEPEVTGGKEITLTATESGYIIKELDDIDVIVDQELTILGPESLHKDLLTGGGLFTEGQLTINMHRTYNYTEEELNDSLLMKRSFRFIGVAK